MTKLYHSVRFVVVVDWTGQNRHRAMMDTDDARRIDVEDIVVATGSSKAASLRGYHARRFRGQLQTRRDRRSAAVRCLEEEDLHASGRSPRNERRQCDPGTHVGK